MIQNMTREEIRESIKDDYQFFEQLSKVKQSNIKVKKLMANSTEDLTQFSAKKLYQLILSAKEPGQQLEQAISQLICLSLSSHNHFSFLLHRVGWFEPPFTAYREEFFKICRLYRATGKQTAKVIHSIIIEGFYRVNTYVESLNCLQQLLQEGNEQKEILEALRQNYPHKLCPIEIHTFYIRNLLELCITIPKHRVDLLEIILQNLVKFDTEVVQGDQEVHSPFPNDLRLVEFRKHAENNDLAMKFDFLLSEFISFLEKTKDNPSVLDELLLVFQKKVLPIKTTKNIQLIMFFAAEQSKVRANTFISFLLSNIFQKEHQRQQNWFRIVAQSNFYLFSYILRSKKVSPKSALKTFLLMINNLSGKLAEMEPEPIHQNTYLKSTLQNLQLPLLILQTIIMIRTSLSSEDQEKTSEIFQTILEESRQKLYFHYFVKVSILNKIGIKSDRTSQLFLKYSNKFLPSTLPKMGEKIDELMRMQKVEKKDLDCESEVIRKLQKGQTPISYCSQTVF